MALELLGPLSTLLKRGDAAYKNYMASGKIFLYAKIIKNNNERIRELILDKAHFLPIAQQSNAIELVAHIDTWHALWENLDASQSHALQDKFSFENTVNFPKESVDSLMNYYHSIVSKAIASK